MFLQTVPNALKTNLEAIGKSKKFSHFYLAGGTALALQLGHRLSYDLDFFTQAPFSSKTIAQELASLGKLTKESRDKDTFLGYLNDTKISFFLYSYPLLFPPIPFLGTQLADKRDIGAMKLDAIQDRGKKRDFVDLFALLKNELSLEELFSCFEQKYSGTAYNKTHLLKSLSYFIDAQDDPMPEMLNEVMWNDVTSYIEKEAREFTLKQLS